MTPLSVSTDGLLADGSALAIASNGFLTIDEITIQQDEYGGSTFFKTFKPFIPNRKEEIQEIELPPDFREQILREDQEVLEFIQFIMATGILDDDL